MSWLSFLIHIPLLSFLAFYFARKWKDEPLIDYYYYALLTKIIAGIALGLVYLFVYDGTGDTYFFYNVSVSLNKFLLTDPLNFFKYIFLNRPVLDQFFNDFLLEQRILIFVKAISLINIFTFNSYWVTGMYLSFFSFLGLFHLSNSIVRICKISVLPVLISFLFFPSVLFWSSGVIKESMLMGTLGFVCSYFLIWTFTQERINFRRILFVMLCIFSILILKFYYFAALVPSMLSCFLTVKLCELLEFKIKVWLQPLILIIIFGVLTLIVSVMHPILQPSVFIESLLRNYHHTLELSHGKNVFQFPQLKGDWFSLLMHFPEAVVIGLFRPLPGDLSSAIGYLASFENMLIVILFVMTLIFMVIKRPAFSQVVLFTSTCIFILMLAFLLPVASPNWGSLARYKAGYIPFFLLLITFRNPFISYLESKFLKGKEVSASI